MHGSYPHKYMATMSVMMYRAKYEVWFLGPGALGKGDDELDDAPSKVQSMGARAMRTGPEP